MNFTPIKETFECWTETFLFGMKDFEFWAFWILLPEFSAEIFLMPLPPRRFFHLCWLQSILNSAACCYFDSLPPEFSFLAGVDHFKFCCLLVLNSVHRFFIYAECRAFWIPPGAAISILCPPEFSFLPGREHFKFCCLLALNSVLRFFECTPLFWFPPRSLFSYAKCRSF